MKNDYLSAKNIAVNDDEIVLEVKNLSKKYCRSLKRSLIYGLRDIFSEICQRDRGQTLRPEEFWVLRDINLTLKKGECLGIIGQNGSGKSTLLKLLIGLIKPDGGTVKIKGAVAPLIALGAGFNPVLSGRENVLINLSILGLSRKQIAECFDDVVAFAELEHAIDAPLRTYSTGMAARLGFACAIKVKPDILIVDEVLAVGDIRFRAKCYSAISSLVKAGTSVIMVSHSQNNILSICDQVIYLSQGVQKFTGEAQEALRLYQSDLLYKNTPVEKYKIEAPDETVAHSPLKLMDIQLIDNEGKEIKDLVAGSVCGFQIGYEVSAALENLSLGIIISDLSQEGRMVLRQYTRESSEVWSAELGKHSIRHIFAPLNLGPGLYSMRLFVIRDDKLDVLAAIDNFIFKISCPPNWNHGSFYQPFKIETAA